MGSDSTDSEETDDSDDGKFCSRKFPVMHSDVLTRIESQVAVFPFNAQPFTLHFFYLMAAFKWLFVLSVFK